jgi:hypothetical protein
LKEGEMFMNRKDSAKPHPQPLSKREGSIRLIAPLSFGEGLGVRFCDKFYIAAIGVFMGSPIPTTSASANREEIYEYPK